MNDCTNTACPYHYRNNSHDRVYGSFVDYVGDYMVLTSASTFEEMAVQIMAGVQVIHGRSTVYRVGDGPISDLFPDDDMQAVGAVVVKTRSIIMPNESTMTDQEFVDYLVTEHLAMVTAVSEGKI